MNGSEIVVYMHKVVLLSHRNNDMGFEGKQMKLEDILLSEVRIRNTKATCLLSYVEDRSKDRHTLKNNHNHIQTEK
jgi:hypothetical protein